MYELEKIGEKTYYIKSPTNVGVYKISDTEVYVIDAGNDKDTGKKIIKILNEQGWSIKGIINTHSNADHMGGNKVIQERTNCKVISSDFENAFLKHPILEPSFLYGGYPFKELRNKFLLASPTEKVEDIEGNLPEGLEYIKIPGHYFGMIGIKTSDNVYFLGDFIFSQETIEKYHIFFIYQVEEYLKTLEFLKTLQGELYIASHVPATNDIKGLIEINKQKIEEIIQNILTICKTQQTFEEILKAIFDHYELTMNANQYVLIGSTIRSYLSYLYDQDKLQISYLDNKMYWRVK